MEMNVFIIFAALNQFKAGDKRKSAEKRAGVQHYNSNDPQTSESAPKKSKSEDTLIVKHSKQHLIHDTTQKQASTITGTSFEPTNSKSGTQATSNARTLGDVVTKPKQESKASQQSNYKQNGSQNDSKDALIASDCAGPVDDGWAYLPILSFSAYRSSMASRLCLYPKDSTNTLDSNDTPKPSTVCKQQDYTKRIYFRFDLNETDESLEIIVVNRGGKFVDDKDGECCYLHLDYLDKPDLQMFVGNIDGRDLSYRYVIESYISFIANRCLQYNDKLKCFVLKKELWGIHAYMSEFYCLIMWKLEALKDEAKLEEETKREFEETDETEETEELEDIIKQKKEDYKAHLIREIKNIDEFINAYNTIQKDSKQIYSLKLRIYRSREETENYFDKFHSKQILTVLYEATNAYNGRDTDRSQTNENRGQVKKSNTNDPLKVDGSANKAEVKKNDQGLESTSIDWYDVTFRSKKCAIFLFLLISDFGKFDLKNLECQSTYSPYSPYEFLMQTLGLVANIKQMQNAYVQILHFIFLIQDNTSLSAEGQTNAETDCTRQQAIEFAATDTTQKDIVERLTQFHQRIQDAMINSNKI